MNALLQAISGATPIWQQSLALAGWHHGLVAAAYFGAAWLCLMNEQLAGVAQRPRSGWRASIVILCLLGVNALLQCELWVVQVLRATAKLQGWYDTRRDVQSSILLVLSIALLALARWWRSSRPSADRSGVAGSLKLALGLLLVLFFLRAISAHYTDAVLNTRVLGVSLGRWFEFGALAVLARSASRALRLH